MKTNVETKQIMIKIHVERVSFAGYNLTENVYGKSSKPLEVSYILQVTY